MKKYDLHVHTHYSSCSGNRLDKILKKAKNKGLNGIAITDHNTLKGALEVKKLNKDKNFEVIVGEEINTEIGHILAYYLKKEIKPGKFSRVIKEIKKQKAISVLAHPYDYDHPLKTISRMIAGIFSVKNVRRGGNISPATIKLIKKLDAIEVRNSRNITEKENKDALKLAKKLGLSITAGSDGHFPEEIGNSYVEFDDKLTLRQAVKKKKLIIKGKRSPLLWTRIRIFFNMIKRMMN